MASGCVEITTQSPQTKFVVSLRPALAETLREWFEHCNKSGTEVRSLDELASEIVESTLAEYRLEKLPPRPEEAAEIRHGRISRATKAEIVDAYLCEEETTVVELAVRFGVGRTTVQRTLVEFSEETGFILKHRPKLTDQQIDEITHAIYVEGEPAEKVARRFERGVCYIRTLARQRKRVAV